MIMSSDTNGNINWNPELWIYSPTSPYVGGSISVPDDGMVNTYNIKCNVCDREFPATEHGYIMLKDPDENRNEEEIIICRSCDYDIKKEQVVRARMRYRKRKREIMGEGLKNLEDLTIKKGGELILPKGMFAKDDNDD